MFVKLCGLRTVEDARLAIAAGASALGFILAPQSKRQVTPELISSVRDEIAAPPTIVGVTVNLSPDDNLAIFEQARLDMLQLSGDEPVDILNDLDVPVIKTIRIADEMSVDAAVHAVDIWLSHQHAPELVIVEGHTTGQYGGTGNRANARLMREISVRYPIVLAGGLDPDNVGEAISQIRPIGVDTASGTEIDGIKDGDKMISFVTNARAAFSL